MWWCDWNVEILYLWVTDMIIHILTYKKLKGLVVEKEQTTRERTSFRLSRFSKLSFFCTYQLSLSDSCHFFTLVNHHSLNFPTLSLSDSCNFWQLSTVTLTSITLKIFSRCHFLTPVNILPRLSFFNSCW